MDVDHRAFALLSVAAVALSAGAVALTFDLVPSVSLFGADPKRPRVLAVVPEVKRATDGEVKLQKGDVSVTVEDGTTAPSAIIECGEGRIVKLERSFEAGKLRFDGIPPERCTLTLRGTEIGYEPVYPGDNLTCLTVERRTQCLGGLANEQPALVIVESEVPGELTVDADWYGPLPATRLRLRPGTRDIIVQLDPLTTMRWKLVVAPGERLSVYFPKPEDWVAPQEVTATAP